MNKGFTLVELLAVIVILSLLGLITSVSITKVIKDSKNTLSSSQTNLIISAAKSWGASNMYRLPNKGECKYITLGDLKDNGLIEDAVDFNTNKSISDDFKIYIVGNITTKNKLNINYQLEVSNNTSCTYANKLCEAVDDATTGNVPTGSFNYGDEYMCEVGDDYKNTFFVLENNTNTVSLIMKENFVDSYVPKTLSWCTDGRTNSNCNNINITGSSAIEGKDYLGHINSVFNKKGVISSLPSASQIATADGKNYLNYPTLEQKWLYDYLSGTLHSVSGVDGYWTATIDAKNTIIAWGVRYYGALNGNRVELSDSFGIRPVITLNKKYIG